MTAFYLTLPSNASINLYPENSLSNFYVHLPQTLELKDQWEVGLSEILFPRSFQNVRKTEEYRVRLSAHDDDGEFTDYYLNEGYYDDSESLVNAFNMMIPNINLLQLQYNKANKRVTVKLHSLVKADIGMKLGQMLGFEGRTILTRKAVEAPKQANVHFHFNVMYIYSDIVSPSPVGDTLAPLLRVIPMPGKFGEMTTSIFIRPHYYPVSRKSIDVIQTYITDDAGECLAFNSGRCIVVLHFRPLK